MPYKNKEDRKANARLYYLKNKEHLIEVSKQRYYDNQDKYKNVFKSYYLKNKEHLIKVNGQRNKLEKYKIKQKKRYADNPIPRIERAKQWYKDNPEQRRKTANAYYKKLRKEKPWLFAWKNSLHNTLSRFGKQKNGRSLELLGYSAEDLRNHLQNLFVDGMSWSNYGEWEIDHKRPVSSFDPDTPVSEVNALSNLQPLWWKDNYDKNDTWIENK